MLPATGSRGITQERYEKVTISCRNRPEIIGKKPKNFRPEYCFHKNTEINRNRQFPGLGCSTWVGWILTRKVCSYPSGILIMHCIHVRAQSMQNLDIINTSFSEHFSESPVRVHYREFLIYLLKERIVFCLQVILTYKKL